jgi:Zn-dependent M16 (insulinase) family peptidase
VHIGPNWAYKLQTDAYAVLKIAALDSELGRALDLITSLLTEPNFDDFEQISKLIRIFSSEAANEIVGDPLKMAEKFNKKCGVPAYRMMNELQAVSFWFK